MMTNRRGFLLAAVGGTLGMLADRAWGQRRRRRGFGAKAGGGSAAAAQQADRALIHTLLAQRDQIRRDIKNLPNGVETLTETDDPQLRAVLVQHVKSMYDRTKTGRPIHQRDPLFAELFRNAHKIAMKTELTDTGIRVVETSDDAHTVKLIQSHAQVVSLFLKNGHAEVRKNHAVPQ